MLGYDSMRTRLYRRGTIGGALAIAAIALIAALTVATAATWNLQLASRFENQQVALELADSAIQEAIAHLQLNPQWGLTGSPSIQVSGVAGMPSTASGRLTFDRSQSEFSTSHVDGNDRAAWSNRPLPVGRIHLVATGRCANVVRTVECMLYAPKFPRAISGDGQIELKHSLVASAKNLSDIVSPDGTVHLDPELLQKGDVICNDVTTLLDSSTVKGSAQSHVSVEQRDGSVVEGEVLSPYEVVPLPAFDVHRYDPKADPYSVCQELDGGPISGLSSSGIVRYRSAVTINGDLKLDNGIVYVAGDLTVQGGLQGVGAVFVEGKTSVGGSVKLSSADSIALISQGDVRLRGDGQEQSFFQGLLATQGSLSADKLTVVGALVAHGRTWISNSRVVLVDSSTSLNMFREVQFTLDRMFANGEQTENCIKAEPDFFATSVFFPPASNQYFQVANVFRDIEQGQNSVSWWKYPARISIQKSLDNSTRYIYEAFRKNGTKYRIEETNELVFSNKVYLEVREDWINGHNYITRAIAEAQFHRLMESSSGGNNFGNLLSKWIKLAKEHKANPSDGPGGGNFNLSLNRFLSEAEKVRVVYRREL